MAAAQRAVHAHPDVSSLKKVVPAAAAIAVATATAAQVDVPRKSEGPSIHRDVSEQTLPEKSGQTPRAS